MSQQAEQMGEVYEGPLSAFDDSRFINFSTLEGLGEVVVEVVEVLKLKAGFKFENGQRNPKDMPLLRLKGKKKLLKVNSTNRKVLQKLFGNDAKTLIGKRFKVYSDPNVMFGSERKGGVRIKPELLPQPQQQAASEQSNNPAAGLDPEEAEFYKAGMEQ